MASARTRRSVRKLWQPSKNGRISPLPSSASPRLSGVGRSQFRCAVLSTAQPYGRRASGPEHGSAAESAGREHGGGEGAVGAPPPPPRCRRAERVDHSHRPLAGLTDH
eukprot:330130-Rhodomonas_salina.1